ncbi:DUF6114 domain-containing protein [Streptomyces badius]|uniref:Integral membrane protein n=1 Tax=Streptomyces badius TaxID=1941 RepID=A0ABQ2TMG8_STRBA|nr:DUF6114 domain-containing protein [Streptomyces badius]GGS78063.1 hypothetical protein GCM10010253_61120 [Streptomyces badius]
MSPESTGQNEHYIRVARRRFRAWRGDRPFWAGLFTILGGAPIAYFPYADLHLGSMTLTMSTTAGAGSLIIGVLLITLGLTMWFHHIVRVFAGIAAILLALISIPVANIGGFIIGFLLSLIGGALSISWAPGRPEGEEARADERTAPSSEQPYAERPEAELQGAAAVPHQQSAESDTAADADGGRHRAG